MSGAAASPAGYDHDAWINAGYDGGRAHRIRCNLQPPAVPDIRGIQSCYQRTFLSLVATRSATPRWKVSLDVETAISAAPGLDHAYVYIAPPATSMASRYSTRSWPSNLQTTCA